MLLIVNYLYLNSLKSFFSPLATNKASAEQERRNESHMERRGKCYSAKKLNLELSFSESRMLEKLQKIDVFPLLFPQIVERGAL